MGLSDTDWTAIKDEMREILINLARIKQPIAYSELAAQLKTAYIHYRAPVFGQILREIGSEDEEADRPMLATLVVNKQLGIPGAGYFKHAAAQGHDVSDPEVYWRQELERLHDYWSNAE